MKSLDLRALSLLLTLLPAILATPARAADPFRITHRGSERGGWRLSARCDGSGHQTVGTVCVYQSGLFNRTGNNESPTPMQVGVEAGQLVGVMYEHWGPNEGKAFVVADASDLDNVKLAPGAEIEMTKRFFHPWGASLKVSQGLRQFEGTLLKLPDITQRLIQNATAAQPIDPSSSRDVLATMLEIAWKNTHKADFSADYFGTEGEEAYFTRMQEFYLTPMKQAASGATGAARKELRTLHTRVQKAALGAQKALKERLDYDAKNGGDVGHANRLIHVRVLVRVIAEMEAISTALAGR